jgi:hypothetical protein
LEVFALPVQFSLVHLCFHQEQTLAPQHGTS